MKKIFFLSVLASFILLSCNSKMSGKVEDAVASDSVDVQSDSATMDEDDIVPEAEDDTNDVCFKLAPYDIDSFKKILSGDVINANIDQSSLKLMTTRWAASPAMADVATTGQIRASNSKSLSITALTQPMTLTA